MELNKRTGINILDNVELLQCDSSRHEYPLHYHDTFCLSIITGGVLGENEVIAPKDTLLISHPFEIHSNKTIGDTAYSFTTFYIVPDLFYSVYGSKNFSFHGKVINDRALFQAFNKLVANVPGIAHNAKTGHTFEKEFIHTIGQFLYNHATPEPYLDTSVPELISTVKEYIYRHLDEKIALNNLSEMAGMDDFKFIRWFKKHVGLTPFNFIILNRIEGGKKMIREGKPLINVALDLGFYDQSHFSNYFKYFVGATPKDYQRSCNIFQDFSK